MPTRNPRVNVTLPQHHFEVITRLAQLQGRSRSAVIAELLDAAIPVLERVVVVGESAVRAQVVAREELRDSFASAEAAILPHVTAAMDQLDMLLGPGPATDHAPRQGWAPPLRLSANERSEPPRSRRRSSGGTALDPRPVTRGSGWGSGDAKSAGTSGGKRVRKASKDKARRG
jgi:hypothetical protein